MKHIQKYMEKHLNFKKSLSNAVCFDRVDVFGAMGQSPRQNAIISNDYLRVLVESQTISLRSRGQGQGTDCLKLGYC